MTSRIVVAISGQVAAGKTTAGRFLERQGFGYTRISWAVKEQMILAGVPLLDGDDPSRRQFQDEGWRLHQERGQTWLCRKALDFLPRYAWNFAVDGLRWHDDVQFFRHRYGSGFIHFHVEAPLEERRQRFMRRDKDVSFEKTDSDPVEQEVPLLGLVADAVLVNDGSEEVFCARVRATLEDQLHAR